MKKMMYCKKCVYPYYAVALEISEDGVCSSCKSFERSEKISKTFWKKRIEKLDSIFEISYSKKIY